MTCEFIKRNANINEFLIFVGSHRALKKNQDDSSVARKFSSTLSEIFHLFSKKVGITSPPANPSLQKITKTYATLTSYFADQSLLKLS